jgi:membrane protein implicated in regulation of membrane protease activity
MPLPLINQIYIVCAAIGSIFLVMCAFLGMHHTGGGHSGGHVGTGGHTGIGHGGAGGQTGIGHSGAGHTAIGHSGSSGHLIGQSGHTGVGHSGASGGTHSGAGHGGASHSGASGGTHSGSGSGTNTGANELITTSSMQATTGPFHAPTREEEKAGPVEAILSALNPTILTTFLAFFGLTGLFFIVTFPFLGLATLAPAFVGGFVAVKVVTNVMNAAFSRMFSSSAATENDLIGHMAEVTVPITVGRTGEVTYIVSSKRYTSPARGRTPDIEIKKGTKVFICEHLEKYVIVDLWTDSFVDPAFEDDMLTPQEKLAKNRAEQMQ